MNPGTRRLGLSFGEFKNKSSIQDDTLDIWDLLFLELSCIIPSVSGCSAVGSAPALGQIAERCQWQMQRGYLGAAVEKIKDQRKHDDFFGHRKPGDQSNGPHILSFHSLSHHYPTYPGVAQLVARLLWELVVRPLSPDAKSEETRENRSI